VNAARHLGVVTALFLTLPCRKFALGVCRCAALLEWAIAKRRPMSWALGSA
jgi:citrate/tricarballylate utilization protein